MRRAAGVREIGDAEYMSDAIANLVHRGCAATRITGRTRPQFDFDAPHQRAHGHHAKALQRNLQISNESLDEPRPVPSFERDLLVVNDDAVHDRLPSCASTASAAWWPLRTALSMVAGRPVSIQSPAR